VIRRGSAGGVRGTPRGSPGRSEPKGVPRSIRVLVADDQALVRAGLRMLLDAQAGLEVAGEAVDGADAVAKVGELRPDVVLMDVRMPGVDGVAATRRLVQAGLVGPDAAAVLVLTTFGLDGVVQDALRAGASGFLLKDADPEELVRAVRNVAAGDAVLDPAVTRQVLEGLARPGPARDPAALDALTGRERAVLAQLALGRSNAEIGARLMIAEETVKSHVKRLLAKLGVGNRVQAAVLAYETGLVALGTMSEGGPASPERGR
jgi:DNA-binding NarL/FixJ family response regulator